MDLLKFIIKIRYLVLFGYSYCDKTCDKVNILKVNEVVLQSSNRNFERITIDSYDSLPIEKILTFHNVIVHITSVVNENKNEYYYNIFLEKGLYKDKANKEYF